MHLDCTTLLESFPRFWSKVDIRTPQECWPWLAAKSRYGYGMFRVRIKPGQSRCSHAHRVSYQETVGEIPDGLEMDHLCRNHSCVNPNHLEAVTHQENMRRGVWKARDLTHCVNGHLYSGSNTYTSPSGIRECRICRADQRRNWRDRKSAKQRSE